MFIIIDRLVERNYVVLTSKVYSACVCRKKVLFDYFILKQSQHLARFLQTWERPWHCTCK